MRTFTEMYALLCAAALAASAHAGVSPAEAARLKADLTPFGAEKAGNASGTIPAWTGGLVAPAQRSDAAPVRRRTDPFAGEKPLFSITNANHAKYADQLSDGVKEVFKAYPETFRINVYPTHRTAAAPQWIYDNTFKNATRAKLNGNVVQGAYGGVPFPIPKTGSEVMWNHTLRWRGVALRQEINQYLLTSFGLTMLANSGVLDWQFPYYFENDEPASLEKSLPIFQVRLATNAPSSRAGEAMVGISHADSAKDQGWAYIPGQRRVRRVPSPCCDTPNPATAGVLSYDDTEVWMGRLDNFDWKLVGKSEMYIPYNSNRTLQPSSDKDVLGKNHIKPEWMRWELHRVWVVEATLREGIRHSAARSRYYCDEDSWICVLSDRWNSSGRLIRHGWNLPVAAPDVPGVVAITTGLFNFELGVSYVGNLYNEKPSQYLITGRRPEQFFSPDALAGEGVR
jgi:Protein of unknown function (DUF1329)